MIIPWQQLDPQTLTSLLESIVLREGTDYGEQELSLAQKLDLLRQQLEQDKVVLIYSQTHESVNVVPKDQINIANDS